MGFSSIIRDWRSAGRFQDARWVVQALRTFGREDPVVRKNLAQDREITDAEREELLEAWLSPDPADGARLKSVFERFCKARELRGRIDSKAVGRTLGHVILRGRLEDALSGAEWPESPFRAASPSAGLAVDYILRLDLGMQRQRLRKVKLRRKGWMWSFYDSRCADDPFKRVGRKARDLRIRLGLRHIKLREELLTLSHRLPRRVVPHVPTTFDASTSPYFRPGGRTKPLGKSKKRGLPEVVHLTTTGRYLKEAIRPAI